MVPNKHTELFKRFLSGEKENIKSDCFHILLRHDAWWLYNFEKTNVPLVMSYNIPAIVPELTEHSEYISVSSMLCLGRIPGEKPRSANEVMRKTRNISTFSNHVNLGIDFIHEMNFPLPCKPKEEKVEEENNSSVIETVARRWANSYIVHDFESINDEDMTNSLINAVRHFSNTEE